MAEIVKEVKTQDASANKGKDGEPVDVRNQANQNLVMVKSPSDTTIYQPAFIRANESANDAIQKISNFVEIIQFDAEEQSCRDGGKSGKCRSGDKSTRKKDEAVVNARTEAEKVVLDVKQFQARIQPPKG